MRTRWDAAVAGDLRLPVNETLGFRIEATADARESIAMSWVVPEKVSNSEGNVQGGVLAAFADALLGGAASAHLPEDRYPALAEMKISIFLPSPAGTALRGTGRVVKSGRRVLFTEAEIVDPAGRLVAKASGTAVPS